MKKLDLIDLYFSCSGWEVFFDLDRAKRYIAKLKKDKKKAKMWSGKGFYQVFIIGK